MREGMGRGMEKKRRKKPEAKREGKNWTETVQGAAGGHPNERSPSDIGIVLLLLLLLPVAKAL